MIFLGSVNTWGGTAWPGPGTEAQTPYRRASLWPLSDTSTIGVSRIHVYKAQTLSSSSTSTGIAVTSQPLRATLDASFALRRLHALRTPSLDTRRGLATPTPTTVLSRTLMLNIY